MSKICILALCLDVVKMVIFLLFSIICIVMLFDPRHICANAVVKLKQGESLNIVLEPIVRM